MTEQKASAETVVTPDSADSEGTKPEGQADTEEQRKQLLDKHAQQGRELKQEREARVRAEQRASALEAEREQARYESMDDTEKAEYRRVKAIESKEAPKTENLKNEKDLLKVIANNDNPKMTKALAALYRRSEERGRFPDKETVEAFVEGLTPDDKGETEEEPKAKAPVRVTPVAGTRTKEPTADELVTAISESLKKKDSKYTYTDLLAARQRANAEKAQANRG